MATPPAADADHQPKAQRRHRTRTGPERTPIKTHLVAVLRADLRPLRFLISGDRERWLPLRLWLHIALFFGIAVASVFVLWVIFQGVFSARLKDELKVEVIRLILYIIAGIGGVFALVIAYRRQGLNEAAEVRVERAEAREESKVYNERFKSASEQMSSDHAANRLAGVYAMAGLADDWDQGRQTCISVLCAYLRMPFEPPTGAPPPEDADGAERTGHRTEERARSQEAQVRETIISVIASRLRAAPVEGQTWHGCDFDFTKAHFDDADFSGILVTGGVMSFKGIVHASGRLDFADMAVSGGDVAFTEAEFSGGEVVFSRTRFAKGWVTFAEAVFSGGEVSFRGAVFSGARVDFESTQFSGGRVGFFEAWFTDGEVDFAGAVFSGGGVGFAWAKLAGGLVRFTGAEFGGGRVDFDRAEFGGGRVEFTEAAFSGARVAFTQAAFSGGVVRFDWAVFSDGRVIFVRANFSAGRVDFVNAKFSGGEVDFTKAQCSGGLVRFTQGKFTGGRVDFTRAELFSGQVAFNRVEFSGGQIDFTEAKFSGGRVDFTDIAGALNELGSSDEMPTSDGPKRPIFSRFERRIPAGLRVPSSWSKLMVNQPSEPDSPSSE
jgi:uncharacterized protein YjbI with pentapeptide repeats